jgi:hypothetical protein
MGMVLITRFSGFFSWIVESNEKQAGWSFPISRTLISLSRYLRSASIWSEMLALESESFAGAWNAADCPLFFNTGDEC